MVFFVGERLSPLSLTEVETRAAARGTARKTLFQTADGHPVEAVLMLMAGRATVMIAHRLSTVRKADRIYVISGGRVEAVGDHDSLMAEGGLYARLARAQSLETVPVETKAAAG